MRKRGLKWHLLFLLDILADAYIKLSPRNIYLMAYTAYPLNTFTRSFRELSKVKAISKEIIDGEPVIKIETRGVKLLNEFISLRKFQKKPWWGYWTVVIFDIPEENRKVRNKLRRKLKELGFGSWQKSVYISPHPLVEELTEFLENEGLDEWTYCFQAKNIGGREDKKLAEEIFPLGKLRKAYKKLKGDIQRFLKEKWQSREKVSREIYFFVKRYFELLQKDPFVPEEIIEEDLGRSEVEELVNELKDRYFEIFKDKSR